MINFKPIYKLNNTNVILTLKITYAVQVLCTIYGFPIETSITSSKIVTKNDMKQYYTYVVFRLCLISFISCLYVIFVNMYYS